MELPVVLVMSVPGSPDIGLVAEPLPVVAEARAVGDVGKGTPRDGTDVDRAVYGKQRVVHSRSRSARSRIMSAARLSGRSSSAEKRKPAVRKAETEGVLRMSGSAMTRPQCGRWSRTRSETALRRVVPTPRRGWPHHR